MDEAEQIAELRGALQALVRLHHDWDKGTAYVSVSFKNMNDVAIKAAKEVLRNTETRKG